MERQNISLTAVDKTYLKIIAGKIGVYRQQFLPTYGDTEHISASWVIRAMIRTIRESVEHWDVKDGKTHELLAKLVFQGYRDVRAAANLQKMLDDAVGVGLDPNADEENRKKANKMLEMMMTGIPMLENMGVKLNIPPKNPPENPLSSANPEG